MNSLLPRNATHAEAALSLAAARLADIQPYIREMWNPDTCPAKNLPWLAWAFSVDEWDSAWTEKQKRSTIDASYKVHRNKGTVGALRDALGALGYSIHLVEWFEESPPATPYTFTLSADLGGQGVDSTLWHSIDAVVQATKNVRSHMRYIRLLESSSGQIYTGGTLVFAEITQILPMVVTTKTSFGFVRIAAAVLSHDITTIYPIGTNPHE